MGLAVGLEILDHAVAEGAPPLKTKTCNLAMIDTHDSECVFGFAENQRVYSVKKSRSRVGCWGNRQSSHRVSELRRFKPISSFLF